MLANAVRLLNSYSQISRRPARCLGVLTLLLVVTLLTTSCGMPAEANGNALALSGALPGGTVNESYNAVLSVGGGSSPYHFALSSGALPPGIALNPQTGSFTGKPSAPGTYAFEVQVTDNPLLDKGTQAYTVKIGNGSSGGNGTVKVSISPANVTLVSGATQQFTATVTGTSNTAVTWFASAGTVDSNGLYTAPVVKIPGTATLTVTSDADPKQSSLASITINPVQNQQLHVAAMNPPPGQQGDPYSVVFTATGGTQPYSFSISSGTAPSGLTMSTSGELAGTPSTAGTYSFTVMVTDAAGATATGNFTITISSGSGFDGPAQLPLVTVPSAMSDSPAPGAVINVPSGGDLQGAFNSAHCGDTIQLQAGAVFSGTYTLPAKNCDTGHWIIVRTSSPDSALPAEGQRATPCYAGVASLQGRPAYACSNPKNVFARIQVVKGGDGPLVLADGANFYRFIGLEITRATDAKGGARLISTANTVDHIILDRLWLHGQTQDETHNGFDMNGGTFVAVIDSYFTDFHCIAGTGTCTDAHAVSGGISDTQDGPYKIQNNFLEASGESIMFGGGGASKSPADIEIRGNHFWKPWQWMPGNPQFIGGPDGHPFVVKNHMELKNAVRVLAEANLMENNWGGFSQTGYGILICPKNQHTHGVNNICPLCQVTDVTIRYTHVAHAGGGVQLSTAMSGNGKDGAPALAGTRWSLHDIVLDDLSKNYVGGGGAFEITNGWPQNSLNTVTINHVTAFPDPSGHMMITGNLDGNQPMYGLVFTNNLLIAAQYPVWSAGGGKSNCAYKDVPVTSITQCFTTFTFNNNGFIASPQAFPPSSWPTGNFFPATVTNVEFMNFNNGNGGNYELQTSSPYRNKGTDGKDLGADIVGLNQALANVE